MEKLSYRENNHIPFQSDNRSPNGDNRLAGWLPIFLIIHKASCHTAHFQLSSHTAPGRSLHMAAAHVLGRKGVSILENRNFLASGYGA